MCAFSRTAWGEEVELGVYDDGVISPCITPRSPLKTHYSHSLLPGPSTVPSPAATDTGDATNDDDTAIPGALALLAAFASARSPQAQSNPRTDFSPTEMMISRLRLYQQLAFNRKELVVDPPLEHVDLGVATGLPRFMMTHKDVLRCLRAYHGPTVEL